MARKRGLEKERHYEKAKFVFSKSNNLDDDGRDNIANFENLIEDIDKKFRFRKNSNNLQKKAAPCEQRKKSSHLQTKVFTLLIN